jgi:hypothetical protein
MHFGTKSMHFDTKSNRNHTAKQTLGDVLSVIGSETC